VQAACRWAFLHPDVRSLEAETDAGNAASQRVLEKCGFRPNGTFGEEGPRFTLDRPIDASATKSMPNCGIMSSCRKQASVSPGCKPSCGNCVYAFL
ncbi:MAG: GNAT family N-acetyltransferase, partial [Oscillospiraceae bacterium]|nr:GNAT family N-acetyltransferase [Oscillospiraceae bacterium]